jgi:hypothetical protein
MARDSPRQWIQRSADREAIVVWYAFREAYPKDAGILFQRRKLCSWAVETAMRDVQQGYVFGVFEAQIRVASAEVKFLSVVLILNAGTTARCDRSTARMPMRSI